MADDNLQQPSNSQAFSVPPAPTPEGIQSQFGGIPGATAYNLDISKFKGSSKSVGEEQAKIIQKQNELDRIIGENKIAKEQYASDAKADIARQMREGAYSSEKKLEEIRKQFPYPDFHPTKDNLTDLATIFGLVGVIGTAMGGAGKTSSIAALNSMAGMMQGWQKGRRDLWEREKKEFDSNMQRVKSILDDAYKDADQAMKLLAYNRDEAMALAEQSAAKLGGQVGKEILQNQGLDKYNKFLSELKKDYQHNESLGSKERMHREDMAQRERLAHAKATGAVGDLSSFIQEHSGAKLLPKDAQEVAAGASAIGHAYALKYQVEQDPGMVGRLGQTQKFFNRYFDSLLNDKPLPQDDPDLSKDPQGQKALVFAKDYATYLVEYERSLSGGSKGFTVQFQKRFNDLLNQDQFNPKGFQSLMNQQISELVRKTSVHSPERLTKQNLTQMGAVINKDDPNAIKGIEMYSKERPESDEWIGKSAWLGDREIGVKEKNGKKIWLYKDTGEEVK